MIMEIRRNAAQRRRGTRTLEALSLALGWHPQHLDAVLNGQPVPAVGEPVVRSEDDVQGRLSAIEYRLEQIARELASIKDGMSHQLDDIESRIKELEVKEVVQQRSTATPAVAGGSVDRQHAA